MPLIFLISILGSRGGGVCSGPWKGGSRPGPPGLSGCNEKFRSQEQDINLSYFFALVARKRSSDLTPKDPGWLQRRPSSPHQLLVVEGGGDCESVKICPQQAALLSLDEDTRDTRAQGMCFRPVYCCQANILILSDILGGWCHGLAEQPNRRPTEQTVRMCNVLKPKSVGQQFFPVQQLGVFGKLLTGLFSFSVFN